jgi:hypothetical protein
MTQVKNTTQPHLSLRSRMLIGAGIGLAAISFFLVMSGGGNPEWGKFWMIRPLILVPFAGAMGGLCNYYIVHYRWVVGVPKGLALVISALVFLVGIWMGIVLGLDGTMWD